MYENLPPELKKEIAWVNVWNGSKIPMRAAIRKGASSVLPETWGDFQTAAENVQNGVYDGIGYVFHSTGLIGIDIDAGRDEDGFLSPMAVDIIRHCGSYTEWSRSGRGVHILVRGDYPKPEKGKIRLKPEYPEITPGSRNLSLTSLAGQLHTQGYSKAQIFKELLYCNSVACKPPLDRSEVELIVNSGTKYMR